MKEFEIQIGIDRVESYCLWYLTVHLTKQPGNEKQF